MEYLEDAEIYEKHAVDLIRYATVLVGPDQAPDVVSTVVLRVLRRRHLSDLENPRAYLFRSVLNEARSWGRTRRSRSLAISRLAELRSPDDQDSLVDRLTAADAVWSLPPRHRSAAYLVYWLDLPLAEAAEQTAVGVGDQWTTSLNGVAGIHQLVSKDEIQGHDVVVIESEYTFTPTAGTDGEPITASTTVWLDPTDGIVVRAEMTRNETRPSIEVIKTTYELVD